MSDSTYSATKLEALGKSNFRSKFHLGEKERNMVMEKGLEIICQHAEEIIIKRLTPATIPNDGKQTPFRGHPVFVAQHATATCCRTCLSKWHHIEKGRELTKEERNYVVALIEAWIKHEIGI